MEKTTGEGNIHRLGLIILGNSGVGKSFICNLIIGEQVFASDFRANAVTTETRSYKLLGPTFELQILDIPGLIEADQGTIERNKNQIGEAFKMCPFSIVLFVCAANSGGRVQKDDIVAFNALNEAYQFPKQSLLFMLNNVPSKRPPGFDEHFLVTLSNLLPLGTISTEKVFILENLSDTMPKVVEEMRLKLFSFVFTAKPQQQKEYREVILRVTEMNMLKDKIQQLLDRMEKDREGFQRQMQSMAQEYALARQDAEARYQKLSSEMNELEKKNEQYMKAQKKAEASSNIKTGIIGGAAAGATVGLIGGPIGAIVGALCGAMLGGIAKS